MDGGQPDEVGNTLMSLIHITCYKQITVKQSAEVNKTNWINNKTNYNIKYLYYS